MGIIPERTPEEKAAHDLSLSRGFGDTSQHLALINGDNNTTTDAEKRTRWLAGLPKDPITGRNEVEEYSLRYGG